MSAQKFFLSVLNTALLASAQSIPFSGNVRAVEERKVTTATCRVAQNESSMDPIGLTYLYAENDDPAWVLSRWYNLEPDYNYTLQVVDSCGQVDAD